MLLNFVRCPRFEPVTTGLSGKIRTHLTTALSMWFRESLYGTYNGDDHWKGHQVRAWSSYASWSLFCHCFVDIQQSFSCIFHIKDGNDFSQFGWTEVNETQGVFLVTPTQINYHGDYHSIVCVHARIEQSVVFKIIFQDLIRWTEMFV